MIGTITLNPSIDQHILVPDFVKDDANRASAIIETPGGKGINVSKAIRELGGKTHAYALLGGLTGERIKALVKRLDFPLSAVAIRGDSRMNTIISDLKDKTQSRISAPGPPITAKDIFRLETILCRHKPKPDYWAFGGSLSTGMPDTTYRDMIRCLQKKGVPCVLDTDNEALRSGLQASPFMIKPNEHETERLIGQKMRGMQDYFKAAKHFLGEYGIRLVVISLGARGALFVTDQEAFHASAPQVPVRSKVGAGDCLIAGILYGLSQKRSLKEAAKLGIAASVSSVQREAPRLCLKQDIPVLLPKVVIRDLKV